MGKKIILLLLFAVLLFPLVSSSSFGYDSSTVPSLTADLFDGFNSTFFMPNNKSVFGNFSFNGGYLNDGLSIIDGDIYAQVGYFVNITALDITQQNLTILENMLVQGNISADWFLGNIDYSYIQNPPWLTSFSEVDPLWSANYSTFLPLIDNSIVNALHRHSELVASDGSPDPALSVIANGNVGIGTTAPQGHLDINTEVAESTIVMINGEVNQQKRLQIRHYEASEAAGATINFAFIASKAEDSGTLGHITSSAVDVDVLTWLQNGNVGIGTTGPNAKLEVVGNILANQGTITGRKLILGHGAASMVIDSDSGNKDFTIYTDGSATTPRLFIESTNGNVGIGTTAPLGKTHIRTSELVGGTVGASADELVLEHATNAGMTFLSASAGLINFADVADVNVGSIEYTHTDNSMRFKTNDAEQLTILSTGNVGIGTTSPGYPLHVNGSVSGISIYAEDNISAEDYLYHSPFPLDSYTNTQALTDLLKIKGSDGKINHSTMPFNTISIQNTPIYETTITQEDYIEEVCEEKNILFSNETKTVCENVTKLRDISTTEKIGEREEYQTSVGMMLGNIVKSIQELFNWNTEQDLLIKQMQDTLCSDGHLEYCIGQIK